MKGFMLLIFLNSLIFIEFWPFGAEEYLIIEFGK